MIDKIRDLCDIIFKDIKFDVGYYVALIIYYTLQIGLFILFGYLFKIYEFIIIGSIMTIFIQSYTYTHHCHKLEHCIILTQILFIIFGILSKIIPCEWSFLFALFSIREIYQKSPLIVEKNKTKEWYIKRIVNYMLLFIVIDIICYYFSFTLVSSCINFSFIMIELMLFKNTNDFI
jgi:hypothetical protein